MPGFIDARGKACPMPVVLAKQQLDKGEQKLTVMVDNETAVENLKRLASHCGAETEVEYRTDGIAVIFNGGNADTEQKNISDICECKKGGYTIFFGKDYVGEGDYTLGNNLAKMALYTLSESDDAPGCVIFMNSGVKLPTSEKMDIINSLSVLQSKGTEILVCGTCLNYYGLTDKLKIGTVSNMYEIMEKLKEAEKIINM